MNSLKSTMFVASVGGLQLMLYFLVYFNLPIALQVIGFLYLTFVPGVTILRLLRIDNISSFETLVFSVGLSIFSVTFVGLLANGFYPLLGIPQPLSSTPLLATISIFVFVCAILSCLTNKDDNFSIAYAEAKKHFPWFCIPIVCLPVISVIGAVWVNTTGNSLLLVLLIAVIAAAFVLCIFLGIKISQGVFAVTILSIAVSLLLHSSLISNYIYGTDISVEYYVFKLTQLNGYWNSAAFLDILYGRYNAMLSITILPTIYSNILAIDGTWVLKIIPSLIFGFVPLGLYQLWQTRFDKKTAFIASFLLMSQATFYTEMTGLVREMIAELFIVLLFLVLLNKKLAPTTSKVLFIIFSVGLVVSHYSIALVFLFLISGVWIYEFFIKKRGSTLTLPHIALFFVIMFSWYIYVSASTSFQSIVSNWSYTFGRLGAFLDFSSRGTDVMAGLGMEPTGFFLQTVSRIFAYATQILIVIGFATLVTQWKKINIDSEYVVLCSLSMAILAMTIILPGFALTLNVTRFYHITLFFLAPLFIMGCNSLARFLVRRRVQLFGLFLTLIVLLPYFLFQTGFVYEVTGSEVWSVPLSMYRMNKLRLYSYGYINEFCVYGAQWMSNNVNTENMQIYADSISRYKELTSYGMIYEYKVDVLSNTTTIAKNGTLYLNQLNVVYGKIVGESNVWNSTEFSFLLDNMNKVYSNGGSETYVSVFDSVAPWETP